MRRRRRDPVRLLVFLPSLTARRLLLGRACSRVICTPYLPREHHCCPQAVKQQTRDSYQCKQTCAVTHRQRACVLCSMRAPSRFTSVQAGGARLRVRGRVPRRLGGDRLRGRRLPVGRRPPRAAVPVDGAEVYGGHGGGGLYLVVAGAK